MSCSPERVLLVVSAWDSPGGLQNQLAELAGALVRRGHDVTVLTWKPLTLPRRSRDRTGALVLTVPSLLPWDRDHARRAAMLNALVSVITGTIGTRALVRRRTTVLAAGLHPEALVAVWGAGPRRRTIARTWLVGPLGNVARLERSLIAGLARRALDRTAAVVAETEEARGELVAWGLEGARVRVLPSGVDLVRFRPRDPAAEPEPPCKLVFTGRFDLRHKRIDLLIEGWRRAAPCGWRLVLAGAGPDADQVRALAEAVPDIELHGWRDPVPLLATAEAFALPTVAETTALAMLEGMASGLPGLVSDLPGLAERGLEGVYSVANHPEAWAQALRKLTGTDSETRRALGRRARAWAERNADGPRLLEAWVSLLAERHEGDRAAAGCI